MTTIKVDTAGVVWKVLVEEGDRIEEGQAAVILESMKMEIPIEAEAAGTVSKVYVSPGDPVEEGDVVVTLA